MASVPSLTTNISPYPVSFSVAIVGGGIGGILLALGLLKYPHIDVHVYESAPSFGEVGAGVTIGPNAQRALELIGPSAHEAFVKHATGNQWASHRTAFLDFKIGKGDHADEIIRSVQNATGIQSVHRARFLDELVKGVPTQRAYFNKRLLDLEEGNEGVLLRFADGTTATADAVVGADGIRSTVRRHLLGKEGVEPVYTGNVAYRGLVPMDIAIEKVGAEFAQNSMLLCGPGKSITSYPIDNGKILNIAFLDHEAPHWQHEKSIVPISFQVLADKFAGWGESTQSLLKLMDTPNLAAWQICESSVAPFYNRDCVVMMGDAAHAMTPFQGAGAGQAMEDALVLETLLGEVTNKGQIVNAFAAYDLVRRPRSQKVLKTSREAGDLWTMKTPGVGDDVQKIKVRLETRWNWIWHRDLVAQNQEAVKLFKESL